MNSTSGENPLLKPYFLSKGVLLISNMSFGVREEQHKHRKHANSNRKKRLMPWRDSVTGPTVQTQKLLHKKNKEPLISSCVWREEIVQIKIGNNAEANSLPSPFQCFESGAVAFSAGGERRASSLTPQQQQHWEASTWGRKQRAPRGGPRGDGLHDSLTVLSPPPVHPCVGPPSLQAEERSVTSNSSPARWCSHPKKKKGEKI